MSLTAAKHACVSLEVRKGGHGENIKVIGQGEC